MDETPHTALKPMDEVALIAAIDDADNRSYGSNLSNLTAELSAQRALAIDLYLGKNVDPAPEGQSNVVDRTVFETVQWMLPSLCSIFANGDDIVTLVPDSAKDVEAAKQEGAYLNWLVTQKHPWFDLFLEWATDALLTKNAYFLVYRDNNRKVDIEKYEAQTKMGVAYLIQDPACQLIDVKQYPAPDLPPDPVVGPQGEPILDANGQPMTSPAMLYDVAIRRTADQKDLCIRVLPPERVKVDQRAFSWRIDDRCNYFEYWEETTLTELREQGFDIPTDIGDDPEIYTQEDYARDQFGERRLERYKPSDPSMRRVKARMIWIRVDADGDGTAELLQIMRVGRHILYKEEVSRIPVASGVACPLPHRHVGFSLADSTMDIQRIKTTILREGLDNLYLSNNPQKIVDESKVNMDDALISRPGGLIRSTDVNAVQIIEPPFVFPQAVQGLEYMDVVRQNRTGVNNNFAGIDQASLNNVQPGTVNQISSMQGQRVEQIARILAFAIEDLFSIVHEQVLKMGHKREMIQLDGEWVEVNPGGWKKRNNFKIAVAFSAGNKDAQISRLMSLIAQQTQAFELKIPCVTPDNFYNAVMELTKAASFAAPGRFWTDPKQIPQPPPQPPPEIVKTQMEIASHEKLKAAEIMQREVESQRKAALEQYAIDSQAGIEVVHKQIDHGHTVAVESLKGSIAASQALLEAKLDQTNKAHTNALEAHGGAQQAIEKHGISLQQAHATLNKVLEHVQTQAKLATGRKVIRKNNKGEITGMDILDPAGAVLKSHTAIKDPHGRVIGME